MMVVGSCRTLQDRVLPVFIRNLCQVQSTSQDGDCILLLISVWLFGFFPHALLFITSKIHWDLVLVSYLVHVR